MITYMITKKVFSWSLYDFGNTAFLALFITFFFPILIKVHLGGNEFQIGLVMGLSILVAALFVPLIGAISDASGKRMPLLIVFTIITAAATILVGYSGLILAFIIAAIANISHKISFDIYDAKMIDIVSPSSFGYLSGFGNAVGYFGTIGALAVAYPILSHFGWESLSGIRAVFWEAAAFYIIFSLPLFFFVPDKIKQVKVGFVKAFKKGLKEIKHTIASLVVRKAGRRTFSTFSRFLAASFMYNNGMNTVIIFLALYGREVIGLGVQQFFPVFAAMALSAAAGSFLFGRLSDKYGPVKMIKVALSIWIGVIILLILITSYTTFLIVGSLGGVVLGAIWTLNRHMVTTISPTHKIAEFFGFEGLTEKFSGVIGPIVFGYLAITFGYTEALISIIVFLIIGLALFRPIKI
ncbi:hypothetical protein COB64_03310 [Candidatus Wolfebacteria bacterium]|nr:MAG: hypothetical protein COB64_03310 [Candidatus Wolfebacteria bacterium]